MTVPNEELCKKKRKLGMDLDKVDSEVRKMVMKPENIIPFLVPGRLVRIKHES